MLLIETIANSGTNIIFAFNGDGKAHSFAVMICQHGAATWTENISHDFSFARLTQ